MRPAVSSAVNAMPSPDVKVVEGAPEGGARGKVLVAIDVLRAFTTASRAFARGVAAMVVAPGPEAAFAIARELPGALVLGEQGGIMVPGCDLGNSPVEIERHGGLDGRTLVFFSSQGVPTLLACRGGELVLGAGYANAGSTAAAVRRHLADRGPMPVQIVVPRLDGDEDLAAAEHIADLVAGRPADAAATEARIRASHAAVKFLDPDDPRFDPRDLDAAATPLDGAPVAVLGEAHGRPALVPLHVNGGTP